MRFSRLPFLGVFAAYLLVPGAALAQDVNPWAIPEETPAVDPTASESPETLAAAEAAAEPATNQAVPPVRAEPAVDTIDPLADVIDAPLRRTSPLIDPYEALGIRAGGFILYPSLETTVGYTTNGTSTPDGPESALGAVTPELRAVSDWSRHEATFSMRGTYETYGDGSIDDKPSAEIAATTRIDHGEEWTTDLAAAYRFQQQELSDPDFPAGVDDPPGVHEIVSSADMRGRLGRSVLEWGANVDRTIYEDGTSDGMEVDQGDRTNTEIGGRLRYGFAVTPISTPFVEGRVGRRIYDRKFDDNGIERSAWTYGLRAGLEYQSDPVLSGEIAVGYARAELDDDGLSALEAMTFDGSIVWSPTELTTVSLLASTELSPATDPSSSGSVIYNGSVDYAYRWRENVTLDALANVQHEAFEGTERKDTTYQLGLGATWRLNRNVHMTGGYIHEWLDSSEPGSDYTADSVRLTLRLQH